jgi:hypothetical protein
LEATLGVSVKRLRQVDEVRDCRAPVVKARSPVFCATAFTAACSLAVVVLTASAAPGAASPVTLRIQGQGIVTVGTRSIHCISASATQIVCTGTGAVRRGRYVALESDRRLAGHFQLGAARVADPRRHAESGSFGLCASARPFCFVVARNDRASPARRE